MLGGIIFIFNNMPDQWARNTVGPAGCDERDYTVKEIRGLRHHKYWNM